MAAASPALVAFSPSPPQVPAPRPLTEAALREGLSLLGKTGDGLAHAYVKFEAKYK